MVRRQLQEAKDRPSRLVRETADEGPQVIALRGAAAVVVVAADAYARLAHKPKSTLVDFLRKSPLGAAALDLTRNTDDLERCDARCVNPWVGG
jgi:prevent-host-death family protein